MNKAGSISVRASWIVTAAILCGLVWFMRDSISAMMEIWVSSRSFNHCFLIAPASAVLIWRRRGDLARMPVSASAAGVMAFACCAAAWGIGALGNLLTLQNLAIVAMLPAVLWAMLGSAVVRVIAFPLAYLFFMVPIGEFLVPWLMELTAALTVSAARLSGVPVYQDGLFFVIPNGSFRIVEACAGLRMLIASVAIAVLFANVAFTSWTRRIVFVVAMVLASIVANNVRTYAVVMMGHYIGMEAAAGHATLGYVVFGLTILIVLAIASRFAEPARPRPGVAGETGGASPVRFLPSALAGAAIVVIAFAVPNFVVERTLRADRLAVATVPVLPDARQGWTGPLEARAGWQPEFIGHDAAASGRYLKGSRTVDAHLLSYSTQRQGREIINAGNRIFDARKLTRLRTDIEGATRSGALEIPYVELELQGAQTKRLVRYWYTVDGRPRRRATEIKLLELKNSVLGRPTPATLVAIGTTHSDLEEARAALDAFTRDVYGPAYPPANAIE